MNVVVFNCGSSSVKMAAFSDSLYQFGRATVDQIGAGGPADFKAALYESMALMGRKLDHMRAAAHRVVHGGTRQAPARVTPDLLAEIRANAALAPLHNPANLLGIEAMVALMPNLPQYVSFDTAFHATNPDVAVTYALPQSERARGLRRYGFHGLSYAALVRKVQEMGANPLPRRLLAFHLGNGASICAILHGQSVATTMGYSPLDGLTMGTRAGTLDPAVVLDLAARHGVPRATEILNRESGLYALGGSNDMRALQTADAKGAQAVDHFCYWAIRHAGSMMAAMGGVDAIAFTGGIGENDAHVRTRITEGLAWAGKDVAIWTVPAEEERQIALEAQAMMAAEGKQ